MQGHTLTHRLVATTISCPIHPCRSRTRSQHIWLPSLRCSDLRRLPLDRARVLELGCASGGNIIPLAARFPNARFLGIDLAQRHIADGRQRIAALGLANVELRQGDVTQVVFAGEHFDYVICHGVFSWVPQAAQDAILKICGEALATNGVATISYNVLPGWHLRRIVRDICLHHVGKDGPPQQRVVGARRLLEQIAKSASETDPYGQLLRNEAMRTARRPASYILGEFLAADNAPCYFHEFTRASPAIRSELPLRRRPQLIDPRNPESGNSTSQQGACGVGPARIGAVHRFLHGPHLPPLCPDQSATGGQRAAQSEPRAAAPAPLREPTPIRRLSEQREGVCV